MRDTDHKPKCVFSQQDIDFERRKSLPLSGVKYYPFRGRDDEATPQSDFVDEADVWKIGAMLLIYKKVNKIICATKLTVLC